MKIVRTYKVELDPNKEQTEKFFQFAGCVRFVYNWALAQKIKAYQEDKKTLRQKDLQPILQTTLREEFPWLGDAPATALLAALQNNDRAFNAFFRRLKEHGSKKNSATSEKSGFPRFKSKHKSIGGFKFFTSVIVKDGKINLPKLGSVKLKERDYLPEGKLSITSGSVNYYASKWFVTVGIEEELEVSQNIDGPIIGVDFGITSNVVVSDGTVIATPKHFQNSLKKLARFKRKLSRQTIGSNNRTKTKKKLQKIEYKIACQRKHDLHQISNHLTAKTKPSVIVLEDLNVKGMLKNRKLARNISERSFGELRSQIEYKAKWYGCSVVIADRWYPSTKTCSSCGHIHSEITLSDRVFVCPSCSFTEDRDLNAAKNLASYSKNVLENC